MAEERELRVTVAEVVSLLKITGRFSPALQEVIERKVTVASAREAGLEASDNELQQAADLFRLVNGLQNAENTVAWLRESGISDEQFEEYIEATVLIRKFKDFIEDTTSPDMYISSPEIQEAIGDMMYKDWLEGALK